MSSKVEWMRSNRLAIGFRKVQAIYDFGMRSFGRVMDLRE